MEVYYTEHGHKISYILSLGIKGGDQLAFTLCERAYWCEMEEHPSQILVYLFQDSAQN
jgi:hypothetical protein